MSRPSQVWWRLSASAARRRSLRIPWSERPSCQPCDGGPTSQTSPGASGWAAGCPAGGLVPDSAAWAPAPARRGFDRWPHGWALLPPALEEAGREASWETLRLYLQDQSRGGALENRQQSERVAMVRQTL